MITISYYFWILFVGGAQVRLWEGVKLSLRKHKKREKVGSNSTITEMPTADNPTEEEEEYNTIPEEYTIWPGVTMGLCDGLSHCKLALAFAVLMDFLGGAALLVGVFVPLDIKGRDFGDLLVYTGALFVLMSLGGWVLWYSGNIDGLASSKELGHIGTTVDRLARTLSRKMHIHRTRGP